MSEPTSHRAGTGMSRRKALVAGAGVVAGAAAVASGVRVSFSGEDAAAVTSATGGHDVPLILNLTDPRRGAFDLYVGTEVVHVVDRAFASRVAGAARRAH